jgi:hypothetical protein
MQNKIHVNAHVKVQKDPSNTKVNHWHVNLFIFVIFLVAMFLNCFDIDNYE